MADGTGFALNLDTSFLKRLDEADKKLEKIAKHTEDAATALNKLSGDGLKSIVDGLSRMETSLGKLSKSKGFSNMNTQAAQTVDAINKLITALAGLKAQQDLRLQTQQAKLDYKKEANDIKELTVAENERARALDRQNKANAANDKHQQALLTKQLANDTKELMNKEQERGRQLILQNKKSIVSYTKQSVKLKQQIDEVNRLAAAYKKLPTALKQAEVNKLITSASKAKTINQHITAINNLNNALRDLDTRNAKYKDNVRRINEEIARNRIELAKLGVNLDNVKKKKRQLMDTMGQLGRSLALVFSVSHVIGYVNKLVGIRKEMELQHKSLQVLLQDRYEADKLWQQTIDLAVRSPFRVKELVTYTKQLAAYRIESDRLHETTRRLADVSAGLGVDMNRLILAYGQVRAAEYLRGTELRQFSEAGIPMLDELSKYFSELEGRAVSAGDVFERVSKRMVSFEDVDTVFQRMTNKGGVFFQMQEKQAETLHGIISNFHDSVDLMLNDLGAANDGMLKGLVLLFRSFVQNWRVFAEILTQLGTIATIAFLRKQILNLLALSPKIYAMAGSLASFNVVSRALNISIIRFVGSLKALGAAMLTPHGILIGFVATLASAISGYMAWQKAIDASNEKYNELSEREANAIRNLQGINDAIEKNNSILKDNNASVEAKTKAEEDNAKQLDILKSKYPEVYGGLAQQKDGTIEATKAIEQQNEMLRINIALQQQAKGGMFQEDFSENYADALSEYQKVVSGITQVQSKALQSIVAITSSFQKGEIGKETFNYLTDLFSKFASAETFSDMEKFNKEFSEFQKTLLSNQDEYTNVIRLTNGLRGAYGELFNAQGDYSYSLDNWFENIDNQMDSFILGVQKKLESTTDKTLGKSLAGDWVTSELKKLGVVSDELLSKAQGYIQSKLEALKIDIVFTDDGEPTYDLNEVWRRKIWNAINAVQKTNPDIRLGVTMKEMATKDKSELVNKIKESVENQIKLNNETISIGNIPEQLVFSEEQLRAAERARPLLKDLGDLVGVISEKSSAQSNEKILNNRINLIKELNKKYEELNKTFDETTSKEKVLEAFGDTFKQAFEGTGISLSSMVVDASSLNDLKKSGELAGKTITDSVLKEIEQLKEAGTYIRDFDEDFLNSIKYLEGFRAEAYKDAGGVWTQGYGETVNIERNKIWDEEKATLVLRDSLTKRYVSQLNQVLDENKELVLTQKQYNSLLDLTYQGGKGAAISLLERTKDIGKGVEYISLISEKIKETMGDEYAKRFGESFVNKFKEAESVYERIAMLLEISNLTIKGGIDKEWYQGMQKRSDERASLFRGDLETSKVLEKTLVRISDIDFTNIRGVINQLRQLAPLAKKEGKEAELALSKAISELETKVGVDLKVEEDKALIDQIEDMFSGYELSLELQKLNIPPDLAKQLFNLDSLTLPKLKDNIIDEFAKKAKISTEKLMDEFDKSIKEGNFENLYAILGRDMTEEFKKALEKVSDMEDKAQLERLKKYSKYLVQAQSERVKIKLDEIQQLQEIEDTFKLNKNVGTSDAIGMTSEEWKAYDKLVKSGKQVNRENLEEIKLRDELIDKILEYNDQMRISAQIAKEGVRKETQEQMDKAQFNAFKESSAYQMLFKDAEYYSKETIKIIEDGLKKVRSNLKNLGISELKELREFENKLFDIKVDKNPFIELKNALTEINKLKEKGITPDTENAKIVTSEQEIERLQRTLDLINIVQQKGSEGLDVVDLEEVNQYNILLGKTKKELSDIVQETQNDIVNQKKAKSNAEKNLDVYNNAYKASQAAFSKAQNTVEQLKNAYGSLSTILGSVGANMEESDDAIQNIGFGLLDLAMQFAAMAVQAQIMGVAIKEAMGPIGWAAMALSAVATIFTGIFSAGDKRKERQIERELALVNKLERAYEDLQRAVEKGYSIDFYRTSAKRIDALKQQQEAYERMIEAERDKKKTDEDKISEYLDAIHELNNEIEDAYDELRTELVGDFKDYSDQLADAMIDALKKGEDGIEAWGQKVDEIIQDIVKNLLVTKFLEPKIAELVNQYYSDIMPKTSEAEKKRAEFDKLYTEYLEGLEELDSLNYNNLIKETARKEYEKKYEERLKRLQAEYERALNASEGEIPTIDKSATDAFEQGLKDAGSWFQNMLPDWFTNQLQEGGELSGLQRGIQGVTEETAQIIEAYLNSIRFFVAEQTTYLSQIAASYTNTEMENPMVSQLRIIAQQTTAINTLLQSLVRGGHSLGGVGLKVFMS